jgi:RES domain-containing protein
VKSGIDETKDKTALARWAGPLLSIISVSTAEPPAGRWNQHGATMLYSSRTHQNSQSITYSLAGVWNSSP